MRCERTHIWFYLLVLEACIIATAAGDKADPLNALTSTFPKTIEIKNKGKLVEFCPDNTCDGFAASNDVSLAMLKDFAYLYEYFFSDYYVLDKWRDKDEAKNTAEDVLSKAEYLSCRKGTSRESARCVLLNLSQDRKIKLLFVRYDENKRNVVVKNISEKIADHPNPH